MRWEVQDYRKWSFNPHHLRWPFWSVPIEYFKAYCGEVLIVIPVLFIFGGINIITFFGLLWFDYYFFYKIKRRFGLSCQFIPFTFLTLMGLLLLAVT